MPRPLLHLLARLALVLALLAMPGIAAADPADIDAAARGVVRVIVIGRDGETIFAVSHGTGFAVAPELIVTNAHVVAEAVADRRLSLGIVPSDGGDAVFARLVTVSERNDLALLRTTSPMRLAPLTIAGNPATDAGSVTAVGYPQNVDRAQGLDMDDLFRAQPPVKSMGFLSGRRPSREFDTLLHTAPIARGSSGGPLLDDCGRVIGVNSFGTLSTDTDAEFFFAVSTRELLPFLRANDVAPRVNGMPCRSLAELDEAEAARQQRSRAVAQATAAAQERALADRRDEARRAAEFALIDMRDNLMALSFVLLIGAFAAGAIAWRAHDRHTDVLDGDDDWDGDPEPDLPTARFSATTLVAGGLALACLAGAAGAWAARPGFATIDALVEDRLRETAPVPSPVPQSAGAGASTPGPRAAGSATLACTLIEERSRITGEAAAMLVIDWSATGCVNGRTQYGEDGGSWTRAFVPASEAAVSVNRFDPATGEFVTERYLLDRAAMDAARAARGNYEAPSCTAPPQDARTLGREQAGLLALLPARPNERLVYSCTAQDRR